MIKEYNINNFFVLTNDKRHCYTILNNNIKYKNINFYYSNERDFYDIWLISLIKYNIVSGSTLSWWGSYLNEHVDKYIVGHNNLGTRRNPEWKFI